MSKFFSRLIFLSFLFLETPSFGEKIDNIKILGNERISKETILMFSDIGLKDSINDNKINQILKIYMIQIFLKTFQLNIIKTLYLSPLKSYL